MKKTQSEAKTQSEKVEYYEFIQDWVCGGCTIRKGVSMKGVFLIKDDTISLVGSSLLKGIPLVNVKKVEPKLFAKKVRAKKKDFEAKLDEKNVVENARISDRVDMLRDE